MRAMLKVFIALYSSVAWSSIPKSNSIQVLSAKKTILVAIIDTGVDAAHPAIKDYIWKNPGETGFDSKGRSKENNNIDDDDNGFVDDFQGWNFVSNSPNINDFHGHGTHIAGIIRTAINKDDLNFDVHEAEIKFMILKYFNSNVTSNENLKNSNAALKYAISMKANIINYSGGGGQQSPEELKVLREAEAQGILIVAAAGNEGHNTDRVQYFPASYSLKNLLSVAAIDMQGHLLNFSNFGPNSISIAAPGQNIHSALPGNKYGLMSGTSQATAHMTGMAAVLARYTKTRILASELINVLLKKGQFEPSLKGKTKFAISFGVVPRARIAIQGSNTNF